RHGMVSTAMLDPARHEIVGMNKTRQLVEQSPIFRGKVREKQELTLDLLDLLFTYDQGLHVASIKREMTALKRYPGDWLTKELERTIEACGVFRSTPLGKFAVVKPELLERPIDEMPVVVMD